MLRICIAGSVVKDTIKAYSGDEFTSLGGVLYNMYGFSLLKEKDFILYPVFYLDPLDLDEVKAIFSKLNVNWSGVKVWDETDKNLIVYYSPSERKEFYDKRTPFLSFQDILPLLKDIDGLLINFIHTGDLPGVINWGGVIYVDLHKRAFDEKDRILDVLRYGDIIQCNEQEYKSIVDKIGKDKIFEHRVKIVVVTGGEKGAWIMDKGMTVKYMPAPKVKVADPTGAGDVFGSVFLYYYLKTGDPLFSLEKSVYIASASVEKRGLMEVP